MTSAAQRAADPVLPVVPLQVHLAGLACRGGNTSTEESGAEMKMRRRRGEKEPSCRDRCAKGLRSTEDSS